MPGFTFFSPKLIESASPVSLTLPGGQILSGTAQAFWPEPRYPSDSDSDLSDSEPSDAADVSAVDPGKEEEGVEGPQAERWLGTARRLRG